MPANSTTMSARPDFAYLDGIRGAAALIVVFYHAFLFTGRTGDAEAALPYWRDVIGLGYLGVPIFIVLSGYVLMLPVVAQGETLQLKGGTWRFIRRRSRRILPPYYAALAFSLALIAALPIMQDDGGTKWDTKVPVETADVVTHLLLIHDFSPETDGTINGPMWSVAVEWHIYFLMPLVLLPLWRRLPAVPLVAGIVLVTLIPAVNGFAEWAHPWLIGLFAIGMLSAQLTMRERVVRVRQLLLVALLAVFALLAVVPRLVERSTAGFIEVTAGVLVALVLVWGGRRCRRDGVPPAPLRVFTTRPMLRLGLISYSVYLLHSPLLGLANLWLLPLELSTLAQYLVMTFVIVPIDLAVCYGFFLLVERRFLNHHQRHAKATIDSGQRSTDSAPTPSAAIRGR